MERVKDWVFESEINLIKNQAIKNFVIAVVNTTPDYNIILPSSSTGKYHPVEDRGEFGNLFHIKKVVQWSLIFARMYGMTDEDKDVLIAAAILHDLAKRGLGDAPSEHTLPDHATIMVDLMGSVLKGCNLDRTVYTKICKAVAYHNGRWTYKGYRKPLDDYSKIELCLHIADMAASNMHKVFVKDKPILVKKLKEFFSKRSMYAK